MSTPDFENMSDEELMGLNPGGGDDISAALNGEESGPAEPVNPGGDDPEPEEQQDASPELVGSEEDDSAPAEASDDSQEDESSSSEAAPEGEDTVEAGEPNPDDFTLDEPDEGTLESQLDAAAEAAAEDENQEGKETKEGETQAGEENTAQASDTSEGNNQPPASETPAAEPKGTAASEAEAAPAGESESETDYEKLYKQITAPFKANGRTIEIRDPQEAVRLMQQGANYVKKMSALKPNLKMMRSLENNGLLTEDKINMMIDVMSGDKAALQKLMKDGGIDPMDIDTQSESQYNSGNHQVSDEEMAFSTVLDDVMLTDTGPETVKEIEKNWDNQSKAAVYQDPDLLPLMNNHRQSGIYQKITAEIDRQKTLGQISDSTTFLDAYKSVGDQLDAQGLLMPKAAEQAPETPAPAAATPAPAPAAQPVARQPVARSPAPTRGKTVNGDRAKAAGPTRSTTPTPAKPKPFDPFNMTDEEVAKATRPII